MPLRFTHYSIVQAWKAVPLFIESDWTMLHLNLLLLHRGFVPSLKLCHLSLCRWIRTAGNVSSSTFYDSTSITLFNFDFSAKTQSGLFELEVPCSTEAAAMMFMWGSHTSWEQCYISYFFVFVCLFGWLFCWRWSCPYIYTYIYIFACASTLSEGVVQFYITHTQTDWCLDIKNKTKHGVVTSVTSL